jgi:hypothetical protein
VCGAIPIGGAARRFTVQTSLPAVVPVRRLLAT